jgi:uncharacterized membrane protein/mono/diheme cytochrome c family protein
LCPVAARCSYLLGTVLALGGGSAAAAPEGNPDAAARARAVFAAKCVECHGADVPKPKGKFGYVLDLKRLAANPNLVKPSQPDESKLWQLVRDDEMPPPDARAGPLTGEEKQSIRAWIAAGASPPTGAAPPEPAPPAADTPRPFTLQRLFAWIGRFHILVVHFPIALMLAAGLGEFWSLVRRHPRPRSAVRFCVLLGAISAVAAAGLGWLHADVGGYGRSAARDLLLHRWLGTLAAVLALDAALLSERDFRRGRRGFLFLLLLLVSVALTAAAGHFGGLLVHGDRFFDW